MAVVALELVARFAFGLGAPPLSVAHETIEYMFKPNQDVMRFGNRQVYNAYGMRSGPVGDANRWILAIGDEVVNGGNLTDQDDLATTQLAKDFATVGVFVGNVSANGWGLSNALAWVEEHDFPKVETAVVVAHTLSVFDFPQLGPLDPDTHPTEPPLSAAAEFVSRYVVPRLDLVWQSEREGAPLVLVTDYSMHLDATRSFNDLMTVFARRYIKTCIVLHPLRAEFLSGDPGAHLFTSLAETRKVPVVMNFGADVARTPEAADRFYRDRLNITPDGQAELAKALAACIDAASVPSASP